MTLIFAQLVLRLETVTRLAKKKKKNKNKKKKTSSANFRQRTVFFQGVGIKPRAMGM
jgi:hypothetical protein